MIEIEKEDPKMMRMFRIMESCVFCGQQTLFWHRGTNNPVCKTCAKTHDVSELRNWLK